MKTIQAVLGLIALVGIVSALVRYRAHRLSARAFWLWAGFWVAAGVLVFAPDLTTLLAHKLSVGRGADLTLYVGLLVGFYVIFRLYQRIENLERQITLLVREVALRKPRE